MIRRSLFVQVLAKSRLFLKATWHPLGLAVLFLGAPLPLQANPYADYLNQYLGSAPAMPSLPTGSALTTSWVYYSIGNDMLARTWGVTSPLSTLSPAQKSALLSQIESEMNYLLSSSIEINGRWWSEVSPLVGDSNVDRFVLINVMEALYKLKTASLLAANMPAWMDRSKVAVDFQLSQYGQKSSFDWSTKLAGVYPNMDAAYTLIMGDAGLLYSNNAYTNSAQAFALSLKNIVQSDGTIPYMATTGGALEYTNVVVNWLALYLVETGDENARAALASTKNYFPKQLVGTGFSEITSGPWFKRSVLPFVGSSAPVDTIAALTSDPLNAYFAQALLNFIPCEAVVGAAFWQPIAASAPADNVMFADVDINGFRGHFGKFGWVGVLNPGQDAFVGATLTTNNYVANSSFEEMTAGGTACDFSNYVYSGTPIFTIDSTVVHTGVNSQRITGTGADRGTIIAPAVSLVPGRHYRITIWYQTSSTMANSAVVCRAQLRDAANAQIPWSLSWIQDSTGETPAIAGGCLNLTANNVSVGTWTSMTLAFLAPMDARRFTMELFNWLGNGSVWYDDLSFTDLDSGGDAVGLDSSLVMVTPEVGIEGSSDSLPLWKQAAYISSLSYPKTALIGANRDFSILSAQYQPQVPTTPCSSPRENAPQAWQVNQTWLLLPERLVGTTKMTSLNAHQDKYVRMRIRTAPAGALRELDASHFLAGGLSLTFLQNDFTGVQTGPAVTSDLYSPPDADEIFLTELEAPRPENYRSGQHHTVAMNVSPTEAAPLASYSALRSGTFSGFRAGTGLATYDTWFNSSNTAATLSYTLPAASFQVISNLYVGGAGPAVVAPTVISGATVSASVPAHGSACIVQSRNLIPNPGLEQVNSSQVPLSFGFETLAGSPVIATSSVSHNGYKSVSVMGTGSARGGFGAWPRIPIITGKNYQVTFWYKSDSVINASAIVCRLMAWKTTGNTEADKMPWSLSWVTGITGGTCQVFGNNLHITATNALPGTWSPVTTTFNLPAPTIQLNIECLNWLGNGTVYYDDLSVLQVP